MFKAATAYQNAVLHSQEPHLRLQCSQIHSEISYTARTSNILPLPHLKHFVVQLALSAHTLEV